MSYLNCRRPGRPLRSEGHGRSRRRHFLPLLVVPILGAFTVSLAGAAQAAAPGTQLVITSAPFTSPASTSATNPVTIKLEDGTGTPTTSATPIKIFLAGSSSGKTFSANSGGPGETSTTLPANTKSVQVFYGDTNAGSPTIFVSLTNPPSNAGLVAGSQTETITAAPSTTVLTASPSPSTFGSLVTLAATVTSGAGTPSGSVTFSDGAATLCNAVVVSSGAATCGVSTLQLGNHSLGAQFTSSSANFSNSTSKRVPLTVTVAPTTTKLTASPNPVGLGSTLILTATVTSAGGSPTGTVTFGSGPTALCTNVVVTSGLASCSTSALGFGSHSLTAAFSSASANYTNSASAPITVTVTAGATTTGLSSSLNPAPVGSSVIVTADVASAAGSPTGTVTFSDGPTPLCTNVVVKSGLASCTTSALSLGSHSLTATFASASAQFSNSTSPTLLEVINPGPGAQLVITSPVFSSPASTSATNAFTVTLEDANGNPTTSTSSTKIDLAGSSAGKSFSATLGGANETSATLLANTQSVTLYYGDTNAGSPSIIVSLTSPPSNLGLKEGTQTEAIVAAATATSLSVNPVTTTFGLVDTLTATVTSGAGSPSGSVTFLDGAVPLCPAVTVAGGSATCNVATLAVALHSLSAVFTSSSANFADSTSAEVIETITPSSTTITLTSSDTGLGTWPGAPTETATVSSASGAEPSGTVDFFSNGTAVGGCTDVAFSPSAPAQCGLPSLDPGSYAITATATPSTANDNPSSSATLIEIVQPAPTVTSLSASPSSAVSGQSIVLTADVPSAPGTVTFSDGSTVLCANVAVSGGSATCSTSLLVAGLHSLAATFTSSSVDYAGSASANVSESIMPGPGVALVISSAPFSAAPGAAATTAFTVTLEDANGNATTSASSYRIFLAGSSAGKRFSASASGAFESATVLPANTQSVTVYYGDTQDGSPTIYASLTSPPSNIGLRMATQIETIS